MKRTQILLLTALIGCGASAQTKREVPLYLDPQATVEQRVEDALRHMTTHEKVELLHAQSKFTSAGVPRLGIRQLNMDDGPHGVREELEWNAWSAARWTNDSCVAFPSLTCLAATWNRERAQDYGNAISEEFAYRGKDLLLGPGANIQRTPMNGRAFEYLGEDPRLAAEMVVPYIEGVQANGVGCCMKHFALNNQETDRFTVDVNVSERAMREIYLPAFEAAVKRAGVWSIMGSYNLWLGVHCSHNDSLLNGILKREWGFDGALVSDWDAAVDDWQSATGGLDLEMGTSRNGTLTGNRFTYADYHLARPFERMIREGRLPMSLLDEKARRVLRTIFRTAMNPQKTTGKMCSEDHYRTCREIGEEGIVLLRNERCAAKGRKREMPLLPLTAERLSALALGGGRPRLLIVGENATRSLTKGGGSSELKTRRDVSPLEGLKTVYEDLADIVYAQGYESGQAIYDKVDVVGLERQTKLRQEALEKAKDADLLIFIGGMNKNHRQDCENGDRETYDLSFGQNELIAELARIQPRLIVVTFGGNPYAMPWLEQTAALLHCWYLGSEAGTALANIVSGRMCPSGKLPVTFARRYEDYPYVQYGAAAYPGVDRQVYYKEDIFVGYRHFDTRGVRPLFPFGYGLSYTTFRYGEPSLKTLDDDRWEVCLDVTNTGQREGRETVQLYVGREAGEKSLVERPRKELKDFVKVNLQPGETQRVTLHLSADDLAFWDVESHGWKVERGAYRLYVASSSEDVRGSLVLKRN
ncbi:MAG: glycoside hydrolase family 3 C-terminal domain-containing protein [Bacteroidaceae bacterium]|nr:glycoside hydrolase family 3 C-terminal domain-containing protein [Bacteroidaceae bacterium]MBR1788932.1 glycoside hydrolase family 3 C-terminal domain-containing protein [Bacteroidaceae bacterium]